MWSWGVFRKLKGTAREMEQVVILLPPKTVEQISVNGNWWDASSGTDQNVKAALELLNLHQLSFKLALVESSV